MGNITRRQRILETDPAETADPNEQQPVLPAADPSLKPVIDDERANAELLEMEKTISGLAGSGAYVKVWRLFSNGAQEYCGRYAIDAFSEEILKDEWGGGKYLCRFFTSTNQNHRYHYLAIDQSIPSRKARDAEDDAKKRATGAMPAANETLPLVMQMMQQQRADSERFFSMMMNMQSKTTEGMFTVMAAMFSGGRRAGGEPASDMIAAMTPLLLENMKPKGSPILNTVEDLVKIKDLLAPGDNGKGESDELGMKDLFKMAMPLMGSILAKTGIMPSMPAPQAQPTIDITSTPAGNGANRQPPSPVPGKWNIQQLVGMLRMAVPMLIHAAQKDSDPAVYHQLVIDNYLDNITPATLEEFYSLLRRPDWIGVLFNNHPDILNQPAIKEWFVELRDVFLNPDAVGEPEPVNPPSAVASAIGVTPAVNADNPTV